MLEQAIAYCGESITNEQVRELLGVVREDILDELIASIRERSSERALKHGVGLRHVLAMVRDFRTQFDVFEKLCIAGTELHDPRTAFYEIDRVLHAAARYKRPVYIEIPRDMVGVVPELPHTYEDTHLTSDPDVLAEADNPTSTAKIIIPLRGRRARIIAPPPSRRKPARPEPR